MRNTLLSILAGFLVLGGISYAFTKKPVPKFDELRDDNENLEYRLKTLAIQPLREITIDAFHGSSALNQCERVAAAEMIRTNNRYWCERR